MSYNEIHGVIIAQNALLAYANQHGYAEVKNTLSELQRRGLKLAAVSMAKEASAIHKQKGLASCFDVICSASCLTDSKTSSGIIYLRAAEQLGLEAPNCIVIENNMAGIDAAASFTFHNAGIGSAATYAGAEYHINRFVEILGII